MDTQKVRDTVTGLIQSKTAWLGMALVTLPDWWPLVQDQVTGILGASASDKVSRIMGLLVVLSRFFTSKSLEEKGADDVKGL